MCLYTFLLIVPFAITATLCSTIANAVDSSVCRSGCAEDYVSINAHHSWNPTGLSLKKGKNYIFNTQGEWNDDAIKAGATGYVIENQQVRPSVRPLLAWLERWRRAPNADWLSLVCAIDKDEKAPIDVGKMLNSSEQTTVYYTAQESGSLYCFANDLPFMYWNNRGNILLSVSLVED